MDRQWAGIRVVWVASDSEQMSAVVFFVKLLLPRRKVYSKKGLVGGGRVGLGGGGGYHLFLVSVAPSPYSNRQHGEDEQCVVLCPVVLHVRCVCHNMRG